MAGGYEERERTDRQVSPFMRGGLKTIIELFTVFVKIIVPPITNVLWKRMGLSWEKDAFS